MAKKRYWKMAGLHCEIPVGTTTGRFDILVNICGKPVEAYCRYCNGNICPDHRAEHELRCTQPRPGTELYVE